jgi:tripartite-type tricarboxylate transporter receptor subunit TctC
MAPPFDSNPQADSRGNPTGFSGVDFDSWFAIFAPRGTPKPIVVRLNRQFAAAANEKDVVDRLTPRGLFVRPVRRTKGSR